MAAMPEDVPTVDQIHAYLLANGWEMGESGSAAYLMVTKGHTIRMLHEPTEYDRDKAVFDISLAEGRHPADVREDILKVASRPVVPQMPDPLANLPAMIRAELSRRSMSQRDFAREVAASPSTITRLMSGRQMCDAATLVRICGWLRIEPADLADEHVNEAYRRGWDDCAVSVRDVLDGGVNVEA